MGESAGFLIYSGIMPLLKTFIAIFLGWLAAYRGMFPPAASRGASHITMNIALPCLIFANIVPAFNSSNISALGPLFLVAFTYQVIGFMFGYIIREIFYVPRNFWQGIIIISGMSNWGNLPNAIVESVTTHAPFNPATDPALGVSFVSIFIVAYHLVFWVGGAAHSLSWDYLPGVPQGENAERHVPWREKPIGSWVYRRLLRKEAPASPVSDECSEKDADELAEEHKDKIDIEIPQIVEPRVLEDGLHAPIDPDIELARRSSHLSTATFRTRHPSITPAALSSANRSIVPLPPTSPLATQPPATIPPPQTQTSLPKRILRVFRPLSVVVTPITLAIAVSLPIALIQDLKALFVDVSTDGGPDWQGPDGRPPLAFVIDTANFVGDIAIPLALILLGASFARLHVPRPLSRLPIMAMLAVSVGKMVLLPVIGVFIVQAMVAHGLIAKTSLAERFVAMFLSGTPAAVNQLIVTSLYAADGNVDTLSAFLLVQYVFMFFSSAALTAVSLLLI